MVRCISLINLRRWVLGYPKDGKPFESALGFNFLMACLFRRWDLLIFSCAYLFRLDASSSDSGQQDKGDDVDEKDAKRASG